MNSAHQVCPRKAWTECHRMSVPICLWGGGWDGGGGTGREGVPKTRMPKKRHPRNLTQTHIQLCPLKHYLLHTHAFTPMYTHMLKHTFVCPAHTFTHTCDTLFFLGGGYSLLFSQQTFMGPVCCESLALHVSLFWSHPYTHTHTHTPVTHTTQGLHCSLLPRL